MKNMAGDQMLAGGWNMVPSTYLLKDIINLAGNTMLAGDTMLVDVSYYIRGI